MRTRSETTTCIWLGELASTTASFGFGCAMVVSKCNNRASHTMWLSRLKRTLSSAILIWLSPLHRSSIFNNSCASTITRHLDGHSILTKIASKDADVPFKRNRPATIERRGLYAQWLAELEIHERLICINESEYNLYTHRTNGRALVGECVHREVCPRGGSMIVILATNHEMDLTHHQLHQFTLTRGVFQHFVNNLIVQTAERTQFTLCTTVRTHIWI